MATENTDYAKEGKLEGILKKAERLYFIGIGGVFMCIMAKMCQGMGYRVEGSDSSLSDALLSLSLAGIPVYRPSAATPIIDADAVIYTTAIEKDNIEYQRAERAGIPLISRADFFAGLMGGYRERIGIAGTHGKSTVGAMCTEILTEAGLSPTAAIGAARRGELDGYIPGGREHLVFEACEYYDAFLHFSPTVATLTNAEWDHPDYFDSLDSTVASFRAYLSLPSVRYAVVSADCRHALAAAMGVPKPILTFGLSAGAAVGGRKLTENEGKYSFTLTVNRTEIGRVNLKLPGRHNVENALAAAATAIAVGADPRFAVTALSNFSGIGRRCELRGYRSGVAFYDDYAHHPTEIRASLSSLRGQGRLFCIFQPHTFTRTNTLLSETVSALSLCDVPILCDVYAAREEGDGGELSRKISDALPQGAYFPTPEEGVRHAMSLAEDGDRIIVMGAGDISARVFKGELSFPDSP